MDYVDSNETKDGGEWISSRVKIRTFVKHFQKIVQMDPIEGLTKSRHPILLISSSKAFEKCKKRDFHKKLFFQI